MMTVPYPISQDDDPATPDGTAIPDRSALMRMATGYLARYAASAHRLRLVLERRIRRRCAMAGLDAPADDALCSALDDLVARLEAMALLDDRSFASDRARILQRKGFAQRRIRAMLSHEGLGGEEVGTDVESIDDRAQALRYAARKRLGAYRSGDRAAFRDKDLRSLLRAGFSFAVATATVDTEPDQS